MNDLTDKYVGKVKGVNPNLSFLEHEIGNYKFLCLPGGTRSGKTYSTIQWIWYNLRRYSGVQYTVVRKTLAALKITALKDFINIGIELGMYTVKNHNRTDNIYYHNGNSVLFLGADDDEKLRGAKQHVLYMNEAPELDWTVVKQLLFRTENKVIIDYNPSYPESWVYDNIQTRPTCASLTTTYLDNPFLPSAQLEEILWMKDNDPDTYKIYGLGQRGELRGQIYTNWKKIEELPSGVGVRGWTIDFGFTNDPTTITECVKDGRSFYAKEHVYATGLDNIDIAIHLHYMGCKTGDMIIAECAEPKSIREIRYGWDLTADYLQSRCNNLGFAYDKALQGVIKDGFYVLPVVKGKDSISNGIQVVKAHEVFVTADSTNAWREYYRYRWVEDPKTQKVLNEPVDKDNHFMDGIRYFLLMENRVY